MDNFFTGNRAGKRSHYQLESVGLLLQTVAGCQRFSSTSRGISNSVSGECHFVGAIATVQRENFEVL
jgi:hypothetical protein